MISKKLFTLILSLLSLFQLYAQNKNDDAANWKKVELLEKKGLTQSALQEVVLIFNRAVANGNEAQQIKAAMYQMKYRNLVEEDNNVNNIFYLDTLIAKTKAPAKNILQSMKAELLWSYIQNNRYLLYNRTAIREETSNDIATWSLLKLSETISALYKSSLLNENLLKATSLTQLDVILTRSKNSQSLRPTLFDFLAHRALTYFMNDERNVTQPSYKFIINDDRIFYPVKNFINVRFTTADTSSLDFNATLLFQKILLFHISDTDPSALIDVDLLRLQFAHSNGVFSNKDKLYEDALKNIEISYSKSPSSAQAMYLRALLYSRTGEDFHPYTNKSTQFDKKKAVILSEEVIKKFPGSEGAINAKSFLQQLLQPSLSLSTEKVNVPGQPFRGYVQYKNVEKVYFKIIKTSREEVRRILTGGYEGRWKNPDRESVKTWSVQMPDPGDYQQHATEVKIESLEPGIYFIIASIRPDFSLSDNIMARMVTHVSSIGYIINNKKEMYVVERDLGTPLKGADVQLWSSQYNYTTRNYEEVKKEKYTSDENGLVKINPAVNKSGGNYQSFLEVKHNNQDLFTDDTYYAYDQYDTYQNKAAKRTFFFTDRSIYRPGQTVFFKGILVQGAADKKSTILSGLRTTVTLQDANGQKAGSIQLQTNDYGSYNSSFKLPEGLINGQFSLFDSVSKTSHYFNVEEYKRPKFFVEIQKPTGTYRLNDSVTIKGFAKSYAGNNIDGGTITYRVVRKVRFPVWWWESYRIWPPHGRGNEMEITNGKVVTDSKGEFVIHFKAIPDETIDKKDQPIFFYEISADVTDINGETRSGRTSVSVSYQALQLAIETPVNTTSDSLKNIRIVSSNLNGIFEKAMIHFELYKLQSPGKIFRIRFWQVPDQFVMSQSEYNNAFPYDAYMDEDQPAKWTLADKLVDIADTTRENGSWIASYPALNTGWYKIIVTTRDKYGEAVKAEKILQISNANSTLQPLYVNVSKSLAQPGELLKYKLLTGFDKVWVIHHIIKPAEEIQKVNPVITPADPYVNNIAVKESHRGGINLSYAFVKHNRTYAGTENILIPWSNKDLSISYETFRDNILPGSEEKWKIKIAGNKGEKVAAEMLVSMYDASLDQFKKHDWQSLKSLWPLNTDYISWQSSTFKDVGAELHYTWNTKPAPFYEKSYNELLKEGWINGYSHFAQPRRSLDLQKSILKSKDVQDATGAPAMQEMAASSASKMSGTEDRENQNTPDTTNFDDKTISQNNQPIQIRKNFNETAFFFPSLITDANGNVEFSFTIPEALTQWKFLSLAHTNDLQSGISENKIITQKPLMIQPNTLRFLREGDQVELSAKIVNMSQKEVTGTAHLDLFDAATMKPVDGWFKNLFPSQHFTVSAGESFPMKFPIGIPFSFNSALVYRIRATTKAGEDGTYFSDGEESVLPVLSNRMLVTETFPLNMRNATSKNFRFDKLLMSGNSGTLTHQALTVEYTSNPVWYAVQALPFLAEQHHETADQNFNRYYANILAAYIANVNPKIKLVFDKWKITDTAALISNLQKNEELKSVLLQETPWVLAAKNESQQKKNIALLFDLVRIAREKEIAYNKLLQMQSPNGGFVWCKGGPDDRYITQYIVTGIGHVKKLGAVSIEDNIKWKTILDKAIPYLDARLNEEYDYLMKRKPDLRSNHLSYTAIQYLYMRSFFGEYKIPANVQVAFSFYRSQAQKFWLSTSKYMQGMIALALNRSGDQKTPVAIIKSLKENAIFKEEMGMYWKEFTTGGYYWHQAPVESQSLLIEAFSDIDKNNSLIDDMKTWLLKQKQTQNWKTSRATAEACYALLLGGSKWLSDEREVTLQVGNTTIKSSDNPGEAGSGYFKKRIEGDKVQQGMGNISVSFDKPVPSALSSSPSWGAVYWQYFEELDKITFAETPLKLSKKLFIQKNSGKGPVLQALSEGNEMQTGDKVIVRIE
ncbi:MAG: alpha-2-macroglobulin family protein, partial [Ferruginibacter sp.]